METRFWTKITLALLPAFLGFSLLFRGIAFHFWLQMTLTVFCLCLLACLLDSRLLKILATPSTFGFWPSILIGLSSAALLYGVFAAGKIISETLFGFAEKNISAIYQLKGTMPAGWIGALIAGVIGPGEEIFWRGFIQRQLQQRKGIAGVLIGILLYAGVHAASGNLMLIAAAAVCGAFWALLHCLFGSIRINILSHVAWDLAVFVVWPLQ